MLKLGNFLQQYYDIREMNLEDIQIASRVHHIHELIFHRLGPIDSAEVGGYFKLAQILEKGYNGAPVEHLRLTDILTKGIMIGDYSYKLRGSTLEVWRWVGRGSDIGGGHWRELRSWYAKFDLETETFSY